MTSTHPRLLLHRRTIVAAAASLALPAVWRGAIAQEGALPTPAQTEGPFYPVELPADTDYDLLVQGTRRYARGQPAWLEGTVADTDGRADPDFQGFGRVAVGSDGRYRFHTLRPAPYTGRTPHIHVKVRLGARELLTTQLYVEGEPGNVRDFLWRRLDGRERAALTRPFVAAADGLHVQFPIVVSA